MIFSAPLVLNALFLPLVFLLGIFFGYSISFWSFPLNLWSLVLSGTLLARLFLPSLATARSVGELQAVSSAVSSIQGYLLVKIAL